MAADHPEVSLVVPCHNEAGDLSALCERVLAVMEQTGKSLEQVCVNDGSKDDTLDRLLNIPWVSTLAPRIFPTSTAPVSLYQRLFQQPLTGRVGGGVPQILNSPKKWVLQGTTALREWNLRQYWGARSTFSTRSDITL